MKQEILEEVAQKLYPIKDINWTLKPQQDAFIKGAKWQQERSFSEEEVIDIFFLGRESLNKALITKEEALEVIKQFKMK